MTHQKPLKKQLKHSVLFKSKKGNRYLFDREKKKMMPCHPVLYHLLKLEEGGEDLEKWIEELTDAGTEIEAVGTVTKDNILYHYRKYMLLKENVHFAPVDSEERKKHLSFRLKSSEVEGFLANTAQVTFEVTERCNLCCEYCGYGKFYNPQPGREESPMKIDTVKRVLRFLQGLWNSPLNSSHGQNIYISFYGGEPLLNFRLVEEAVQFVKELDLLHNRVTFSMTTNGLLLEKYMDFLAANDFNLLISLDGDEGNNGYRLFRGGKPAFAVIRRNIAALQSAHPDYFDRKVNFNAVIHNKNSVSEVLNYIRQQFGKIPQVSALNSFGVLEEQKETFWKTYSNLEESLYKSEDYSATQKEMFINLPNVQGVSTFLHMNTDFCFNNYNEMLYDLDRKARCPTGTCLPFSKKIFITANGKILPCERISHDYVLGNVDRNGVNIDYEEIAARYNQWYERIVTRCRGCYNADTCAQCMFYLDLESARPVCGGFFNPSDYKRFVNSQVDFLESNRFMYSKILKEVVIS